MSTLTAPASVQVDDLTFGYVNDDVTGWLFSNLEGWFDGPSVQTAFIARPGKHGSFDGPVYRDLRVVTITGVYIGNTHDDAFEASKALAGLLGDGSSGTVTVVDSAGGSQSATVRLSAPPILTWDSPAAFHFQVSFTAPDPRKYGDVDSGTTGMPVESGGLVFPIDAVFDFGTAGSTGTVSVANAGTADTPLQLRVDGSVVGGFQLTETQTGSVLQFVDDVPDGAWVTIDPSTGRVIVNDQADRRGSLVVAQFAGFIVPRGGFREVRFDGLGGFSADAVLTVSIQPAFW